MECLDNVSISNLFGNLQDRINFLLPTTIEKEQWRLSGKMYRSKLPISSSDSEKFNTICTLQEAVKTDGIVVGDNAAFYLINKEIIKADPFLDSILSKLNLMYSVRQSYSIEGHIWKSADDQIILKCATIYSGSEAVNILIQVQTDEVLEKVFPDFKTIESNLNMKIRIEEVTATEISFDDSADNFTFKYFDIIIKTVKLNL